MASSYTATPLQDVVRSLESTTSQKQFGKYQYRLKGNLEVLKMFSESTDMCVDKTDVVNAFMDAKRVSGQTVSIDLKRPMAVGSGSAYTRIGSGGATTVRVALNPGTIIEEGADVSKINELLRRYDGMSSNYGQEGRLKIEEQFKREYEALFLEKIHNVLLRLDAAAQAFVVTNIAATGGLGDEPTFTTVGNYRMIPAGKDQELFYKLADEARKNRIINGNEDCYILGTNRLGYLMDITAQYGQQNQQNTRLSLDRFTPFISNSMALNTPATDEALMFLIAKGGVGFVSIPDFHTEKFKQVGQDGWELINLPRMPFFENELGIDTSLIKLHVKTYEGHADTSATYTTQPLAVIDYIKAFSIVTQPTFFTAYTHSTDTYKPIVGFRKDAVA